MNSLEDEIRILNKLKTPKQRKKHSILKSSDHENDKKIIDILNNFISFIKNKLELKKKILIEKIILDCHRKEIIIKDISQSISNTYDNLNKGSFDNKEDIFVSDINLSKIDQKYNLEIIK